MSVFSPGLVPWYEGLGYQVRPGEVYAHASPLSPQPLVLVRDLDAHV